MKHTSATPAGPAAFQPDQVTPNTKLPRMKAGHVSSSASLVELTRAFSKLPPALERAIGAHVEIHRRVLRPVRTQRRTTVHQVLKLQEKDLLAAEAQYSQGATLREITAALGIDRRRLAAQLRARGVGIRRRSPTEAEIVEMIRRYESGESLARVGERLGFDAGTVRNHLVHSGIEARDCHGREH